MPEVDLIKRAVRVGAPAGGPRRDILVDPNVDWTRLLRLAEGHGVLALVARAFKEQGWTGVPAEVVQTLTEYRLALTARNLFMTRRLLEILELLHDEGITALPYKGPALAAVAYGDVGMRPFGDLDLIISEDDLAAARQLLLSSGFRSLSPHTDSRPDGELQRGYALALQGSGTIVELHWKLAPSSPLRIESLLPGVRPLALLGSQVPSLSPEQLLLVLCTHGAKHAWERFEWVCGVAHVIGRHPDLDWAQVEAEARELGADRAVALGLALAAGSAGAPVPAAVLWSTGATRVQPLAASMERALLREPPSARRPLARHWLRLRAATLVERVRYVRFLRHPTEKDRAFLSLPRRLSFLYVVVRPLRVACDRGLRPPGGPSRGRLEGDRARRALVRQLEHQGEKAARLRGREDEVAAALAERWGRVQRRLSRIEPEWEDPRMLEVGSGAHGILFGSGSRRAIGVDPLAVEYARLFPAWQGNLPTVAAEGERLPFADGTFDVVLCDNVVDHAEQPDAIVAELTRLLARGGLLYFTVNVHHRLYSLFARAHRAWNRAGILVEIGPFADHTVHLTPGEARRLFAGLPLDVCRERLYVAEAKERARHRRIRHPGHLLPLVFFKNARFELIARRR